MGCQGLGRPPSEQASGALGGFCGEEVPAYTSPRAQPTHPHADPGLSSHQGSSVASHLALRTAGARPHLPSSNNNSIPSPDGGVGPCLAAGSKYVGLQARGTWGTEAMQRDVVEAGCEPSSEVASGACASQCAVHAHGRWCGAPGSSHFLHQGRCLRWAGKAEHITGLCLGGGKDTPAGAGKWSAWFWGLRVTCHLCHLHSQWPGKVTSSSGQWSSSPGG